MKRDYHAKLVVYGIPQMKSVTFRRLVDWLEAQVKELKKNSDEDYSKIFTAKLMK